MGTHLASTADLDLQASHSAPTAGGSASRARALHRAADLARDGLVEGRRDLYRGALALAELVGTPPDPDHPTTAATAHDLEQAARAFAAASSVTTHLWGSTGPAPASVLEVAAQRARRELVLLGKAEELLNLASAEVPDLGVIAAILQAEDAEGAAYLRRQLAARASDASLAALARHERRAPAEPAPAVPPSA